MSSVPPPPPPPASTPPPPPPAPPPPPPPPPPAGGTGYGAPVIDGIPAGAQISSKGKRFGEFLLETLLAIVTLVIGWLIWSFIVWGKGLTPAKQVLRMRVVDLETGTAASWGTMALREIVGRWLLGFVPFYTLISCIVLLADDRAQALWDKIASTVVVEDPDGRLAPP
jgi:uncharacterized RDD family membrane protein YckC